MSGTPFLFEVPKTHPGRADKLKAFKLRQGIWTWHCKDFRREDHPWEALLVPRARRRLAGYDGIAESDEPEALIMNYCRLLEEWGLLVSGETELQAVRNLCAANEIPSP